MKKIFIFFCLSLLIASNAWALNCKTTQSGNSDECWSEVSVTRSYWEVFGLHEASRGKVVVVSIDGTEVAQADGYSAQFSTTSTDMVLGVIQKAFTSVDSTQLVLVRGRGEVLTIGSGGSGGVTSRDVLAITEGTTLSSRAGRAVIAGNSSYAEKRIGVALETNTTGDSLTESYINIL